VLNDLTYLLGTTAIQAGAAIVFALLLHYFSQLADRSFLRFLSWTWLAFGAYTVFATAARIAAPSWPPTSALRVTLSILSLTAGMLQVIWLVLGTYELTHRRRIARPRIGLSVVASAMVATGLTLAWIDDPSAASLRYFTRVGVRAVLLSIAFIGAGAWFAWRTRQERSVGSRLLPAAMALYGIDQLFAVYHAAPIFAPSDASDSIRLTFGQLDLFLQLLIGVGMLIWLLEKERLERIVNWGRMAESEERYRSVAESANDAIITFDQTGMVMFANAASERVFGFTADEIVGRPLLQLTSGNNDPTLRDAFLEYQRMGVRRYNWSVLNVKGRHKSGREIPIEMSLSEHEQGGRRLYTGIMRDLSDRVRLEHQLLQAQKMDAVGRLAGGIAHDFNNMMMAISVNADLSLIKLDPSHPARTQLLEISATTRRAADLTAKLLTFSRQQPLRPQLIDLNHAVTELSVILRRLISKEIALSVEVAREALHVQADASLVDQALLNLALNARDAMPSGGRLAIVTSGVEFDAAAAATRPDRRAGAFVCLRVADTGTGITPEDLPRIFEPFFTTKDVGKGTGLGLATTFGVVQQHGGWIEVHSTVGTGTTFSVFLPRVASPAATALASPAALPAAAGHETILLAEDEEAIRVPMAEALSSQGYVVIEAPDGPGALERAAEHGPGIDLLLTDLAMPGGMTGFDLASALRRSYPALRVVFISGHHQQSIWSGEGDVYLAKPVGLQEMSQAVRRCLDARPVS
jgi:PAS domain S-box-containing protein